MHVFDKIDVSYVFYGVFSLWFGLVFFLVASEGDTVASHQGYHVQYVEPEIYATQTNGGQAQM